MVASGMPAGKSYCGFRRDSEVIDWLEASHCQLLRIDAHFAGPGLGVVTDARHGFDEQLA